MARDGPLRLGTTRRYETGPRVRLWRGAGVADVSLDEGSRFPAHGLGDALKMSALRIAEGEGSFHCAACHSTDAGMIH
jgi:hypothetical protein